MAYDNSNIYTRRVLAGEFQIVCPWLLRELVDRKLWDDQMKNMIIAHNGSVQNIPTVPDDIKAIYKTVWEISQKKILDMAADRGAFICQSQSLNVHLQSPTIGQLTSMHFYGWKKGLKTGMYYLRTRPAAQAIKFTVDQSVLKDAKQQQADGVSRSNGISKTAVSVSPSTAVKNTVTMNGNGHASHQNNIKQEPVTPSLNGFVAPNHSDPPSPSMASTATSLDAQPLEQSGVLSLDDRTQKAAEQDPEFASALQRQRDRELEQAKLMCSLENKEACLMCSG